MLLDNVHDQLTQDMMESVSGNTATLVQDGWSNIHNEPIAANCLQLLSAPAFAASNEKIFQALAGSKLRYGIALVMRKQPSSYFVTESSGDFVI